MSEFKVGDVVRLNSSYKKMTIDAIDGTFIYCAWLDDRSRLQCAGFPDYMLTKSELTVE